MTRFTCQSGRCGEKVERAEHRDGRQRREADNPKLVFRVGVHVGSPNLTVERQNGRGERWLRGSLTEEVG
jgi:hypothetical protein